MLKIIRISFVGLAFVFMNALPVMAQECNSWADKGLGYWKKINVEEVQLCLDNGADVRTRDHEGYTPLHWAVRFNKNLNVTIALLNAGANANARDEWGSTPLHWAANFNKNHEAIVVLLKGGADVNARTKDGYTPLHAAARGAKNPNVIIALLVSGANGKVKDGKGKTAFDYAKNNNFLKETDAYWKLNEAQY